AWADTQVCPYLFFLCVILRFLPALWFDSLCVSPSQISFPSPRSSVILRWRGTTDSGVSSESTSSLTSSLRSRALRFFACSRISATDIGFLPIICLHYTR